jgi:uncharacterized membrane protein YeaQ/YmgE (transglycosylase-associated protein family)
MAGPFVLVLIVAGAYLAAHWAFEWLGARYLLVSGAEYLLLGILLGPQVSGVLEASVLNGFAPFMTLAVGWIGAAVGSHFYLPRLVRTRNACTCRVRRSASLPERDGRVDWRVGVAVPTPLSDTIGPAAARGSRLTERSPAGVAMLTRRLERRGLVVRQIEVATGVDAFVAIVAFSLLLCIEHVAPSATAFRAPTPTEWAVISVALGCVGGSLFHLFLGNERDIDRLFISIAGAVILVSGAAAYLRVSPLLPTMLVGAMSQHAPPVTRSDGRSPASNDRSISCCSSSRAQRGILEPRRGGSFLRWSSCWCGRSRSSRLRGWRHTSTD